MQPKKLSQLCLKIDQYLSFQGWKCGTNNVGHQWRILMHPMHPPLVNNLQYRSRGHPPFFHNLRNPSQGHTHILHNLQYQSQYHAPLLSTIFGIRVKVAYSISLRTSKAYVQFTCCGYFTIKTKYLRYGLIQHLIFKRFTPLNNCLLLV